MKKIVLAMIMMVVFFSSTFAEHNPTLEEFIIDPLENGWIVGELVEGSHKWIFKDELFNIETPSLSTYAVYMIENYKDDRYMGILYKAKFEGTTLISAGSKKFLYSSKAQKVYIEIEEHRWIQRMATDIKETSENLVRLVVN